MNGMRINAKPIWKSTALILSRFTSSTGKRQKSLADLRYDYGEPRAIAFGMIDARLYVLVHTWREGTVRVIGFKQSQ